MKRKMKVAAIQAAPVYLELEPTIEKACRLIREAADNGTDLIAFPEAYFPGYPYWAFMGDTGYTLPYYQRLYKNALEVPGEPISQISDAARKNNIFVCASGTEKVGGSLYLTQFWFDRQGNLIGKHQKIRPTSAERTVWGEGDGSTMQVYQTEIGRLGGLQCWEHLMPANQVIMASMNEQIHVAAWTNFNWEEESVHHYSTGIVASTYYAITTGTFVIATSTPMDQKTIDDLCGNDEIKRKIRRPGNALGARIINPAGKTISNIVPHDKEGIAYADIDLDDIIEAKYNMDCAGHYSKGGIAKVVFDKRPVPAVMAVGNDSDYRCTYEELHQF